MNRFLKGELLLDVIIVLYCTFKCVMNINMLFKTTYFDFYHLGFILFWLVLAFIGFCRIIDVFYTKEDSFLSVILMYFFHPIIIPLFFLSLGVFSLYAMTVKNNENNTIVITDAFVLIEDVINNYPHVSKGRSHGFLNDVELHLKKFPEFKFVIPCANFTTDEALYFNRKMTKGDSVKIYVAESEYLSKIEHRKPLSFWQKHYKYNSIRFSELQIGKDYYFSRFNEKSSIPSFVSGISYWLIISFSVICIIISLVMFYGIFGKDTDRISVSNNSRK